jgi:hypothetical protein
MEKTTIIINTPLSSKKENVFKGANNDIDLVNAIDTFKEKLKNNNIEVWEQKDNILVTENGYYLAVYPENINPI